MKITKRSWIAVAALAAFIFLSAEVHAEQSSYQAPTSPVLIRPFGDSITFGVGYWWGPNCPVTTAKPGWCTPPLSTGGGYRGWMTWMVLASLGTGITPPIIFTTEGHQTGGSYNQQWQTSTQDHDGYPGARTDELLPYSKMLSVSSMTLVHLGTNDILQSTPIAKVATNLFANLDNLLAKNTQTHIFVAQIIPFAAPAKGCKLGTGPCLNFTVLNGTVTLYNQMIHDKWSALPPEKKDRITVVDMSGLLDPQTDYFTWGIHPNVLGYLKMACTWMRGIKGLTPNPVPAPGNWCKGIGPQMPPMPPMGEPMGPPPEWMKKMMQGGPPPF